jgi:hypothetical protein
MILFRDYNEEKRLDRAWYSSSNIVYSECDDIKDDYKTLRVVFKNGSCYEYKNVSVMDYLMFMHGGLDGSNGKSLNKFIKENKYEYERLDNKDLNIINEEMEKLLKEKEQNTATQKEECED